MVIFTSLLFVDSSDLCLLPAFRNDVVLENSIVDDRESRC